MIVLAFDTCFHTCSVALAKHKAGAAPEVIAASVEDIGTGHAERLAPMIARTLQDGGVQRGAIERIAVTTGPGSFTGVRIGVAAARALAFATGAAMCSASRLHVMAAHLSHLDDGGAGHGRAYAIAIDAKRGQIYLQRFGPDHAPIAGPELWYLDDLSSGAAVDLGEQIFGPCAHLVAAATGLAIGAEPTAAPDAVWGDARDLARLAGALPVDTAPPSPLYLRAPDAKPQVGKAIPRVGPPDNVIQEPKS